jgi:hypothetical protein
MGGEHRRGPDDDLLHRLRALGADHEPDRSALRRRIGLPEPGPLAPESDPGSFLEQRSDSPTEVEPASPFGRQPISRTGTGPAPFGRRSASVNQAEPTSRAQAEPSRSVPVSSVPVSSGPASFGGSSPGALSDVSRRAPSDVPPTALIDVPRGASFEVSRDPFLDPSGPSFGSGSLRDPAADRTRFRRSPRRRPSTTGRSGRPAPAARESRGRGPAVLSAAALLLVVGGVVLLVRGPADGGGPTPPASVAEATVAPPTAPSATPVAVVDPVASTASGSRSTGPSATSSAFASRPSFSAGARRSDPAPTPAGRAGAAVTVTVDRPTAATTPVDLSAGSGSDWIAVGARADLKQVRAKARAAQPLLTVEQPPGAGVLPGPYRVSWVGGLPEQDHDDATTWLARSGPDGLDVVVAASTRARTVVLRAGAGDLEADLTVRGQGLTGTRTSLGTFTGPARAVVVTVRLPASGAVTLSLGGHPVGETPTVGLAAVTAAE